MKTIFVGLSGGVDSAVSAHLLKKAGHRVVGVFMKVWEPDFLPCTSGQDRLDAMRVAAHLEIPFLTYDFEEEYQKGVVDYFVDAYRRGKTPNPDVLCNRTIKFGTFWQRAQSEGADAVATGHYAISELHAARWKLHAGVDATKDQSYFLWTLTQSDLSHVLFPVGGLLKSEVRRIADAIHLPNATKKDSQGLCFLGHVAMKEFLQHYLPTTAGEVKDETGAVVGRHDGAWFYTVGERFPLGGDTKVYVVGKDVTKNTLTVSSKPTAENAKRTYDLSEVNWIRETPVSEQDYVAQVRYHGEKMPCRIEGATSTFKHPVMVAEGQSVVVYDEVTGECIGGGVA